MPIRKLVRAIGRPKPLSREEGMRILVRDRFRCQYCGLDGTASLDHALMMTVDFVVPRALRGKKDPSNLVAACRPCNLMKGRHRFRSFEEAKRYVLQRREEKRKEWEKSLSALAGHKTAVSA
jgi:5-methylcytosine-specific restriction endonuclease McrA